jgi:LacI family transcriptional regulator
MAGYFEALQNNNIEKDETLISYAFLGGMDDAEIDSSINRLFLLKKKPDAIICFSDKLTTGAMKSLKRRGLKIPNDMALTGFLNSEHVELFDPPLTVVKQPAFEMGKAATELLLQLIESKRNVTSFERRILSPELVIRSSTLPQKK